MLQRIHIKPVVLCVTVPLSYKVKSLLGVLKGMAAFSLVQLPLATALPKKAQANQANGKFKCGIHYCSLLVLLACPLSCWLFCVAMMVL